MLPVSQRVQAHLSAELSGSMNRISGGADSVSVANIPPCSWTPKPFSGSPVKTTSLVSTWTTWPPGPTELDARDTKYRNKNTLDRFLTEFTSEKSCYSIDSKMELTGALVLFLSLSSFEQRVAWTHGNCRPGQGAGALATGTRCGCGTRRETGRHQSCKKRERNKKKSIVPLLWGMGKKIGINLKSRQKKKIYVTAGVDKKKNKQPGYAWREVTFCHRSFVTIGRMKV